MATEGELRNNNMDDSDRVRELQEQVAELKAEVKFLMQFYDNTKFGITKERSTKE